MRVLIFDDEKYRHVAFRKNFIGCTVDHAMTVDQVQPLLKLQEYDAIFLDCDIMNDKLQGTDLTKWMVENKDLINWPKWIFIHSLNHVFAKDMHYDLIEANVPTVVVMHPWAWAKLQYCTNSKSFQPKKDFNLWEEED